jgi:hypothetical protein
MVSAVRPDFAEDGESFYREYRGVGNGNGGFQERQNA